MLQNFLSSQIMLLSAGVIILAIAIVIVVIWVATIASKLNRTKRALFLEQQKVAELEARQGHNAPPAPRSNSAAPQPQKPKSASVSGSQPGHPMPNSRVQPVTPTLSKSAQAKKPAKPSEEGDSAEKAKKGRRAKPVIPFGEDKTHQGVEGVAAFSASVQAQGVPNMAPEMDERARARAAMMEQDRRRLDARAARQDRISKRFEDRDQQNLRRQAEDIRRQMREEL